MAEEPQGTAENGENEGQNAENGEDKRIPYSRFEEVNKRAKAAEVELEDLRSKLLEFEDRDKSEVERAQARAQRAETALQQLSGEVSDLKKGAWVRSAAAEMDFHDPEDAVSHLRDQLARFEDASDAKRAVRALAKGKKHLLREENKGSGKPGVGQMFAGQQVAAQQPNGQAKSPQQMAAERELQFAQSLAEQLNQYREGWHNIGGVM